MIHLGAPIMKITGTIVLGCTLGLGLASCSQHDMQVALDASAGIFEQVYSASSIEGNHPNDEAHWERARAKMHRSDDSTYALTGPSAGVDPNSIAVSKNFNFTQAEPDCHAEFGPDERGYVMCQEYFMVRSTSCATYSDSSTARLSGGCIRNKGWVHACVEMTSRGGPDKIVGEYYNFKYAESKEQIDYYKVRCVKEFGGRFVCVY